MEKNTNTNANTNININIDAVSETSPDQRHRRERSPMAASPPPPARIIDDINNPPTDVIEPSSSIVVAAPESVTPGDVRRRQSVNAMFDVGTSSHEHVGGSSDVEAGKKRGRGDGGEQQQQVKAAKKKGELTEVPKGEPRCATCNKVFKSWKALFGHLRSHPERTYRGALPPPTAAELDIRRCQQQLASTLLTVAQQVSASRRGLDIDLNQPSTADDGDSPDNTRDAGFDLNLEPPPESDDEK
ncbi:uncharacterized protein LOC105435052 [Cucumis sativus]|uniref:C2H2-type domain-containing protein n=1 Tax=Cucumis sativus TaxID=3659 RepID=A0A0A0L0X7_CUCSA|nr:uncharacterized protein LOC105435052 [Cucumis sativus]KGN55600.1 hypothetical protein Csa_009908 [Cucumis sativus]